MLNSMQLNGLSNRPGHSGRYRVCASQGMRRNRRGQALVEYALGAFLTAFFLAMVMKGVLTALHLYYREVTTLVSLPIP